MEGSEYVIKLRGLPFSATVDEVMEFLSGVNIFNGKEGVHITEDRPGRPSGQCYVEVASPEDIDLACLKDKKNFGKRYIEVFVSTRQGMLRAMKPHLSKTNNEISIRPGAGIVRLRGLPFDCCDEDIQQFFDGLELIPDGINILSDHTGRPSGEAFVQFVDKETAERALEKDREKIGHRYIEVFLSSEDEACSSLDGPRGRGGNFGRPTPYDRPGGDRFGGPRGFDGPRGYGSSRGGGFRGAQPAWNRNGGGGMGNGGGSYGGGGLGSYGGGSGGPYRGGRGDTPSIHMRGLPYSATLSDISYFFKPVRPLNITILYDNTKRPSGEADVVFESHQDAAFAMQRNKCNMDNRYIELFLNSSGGGGLGGGGYGRGGGAGGGGNYNRNFRN